MAATAETKERLRVQALAHIDQLRATGKSMAWIAQMAGFDASLISRWRRSENYPSPHTYRRILAVTPDQRRPFPTLPEDNQAVRHEFEHMKHILSSTNASLHRLADAYCVSVATIEKRLRDAGEELHHAP